MQFKDLNIKPTILRALEKEKYSEPTPIQEKAIPAILDGSDLLGSAQTGTGKTAAFAIPIIQLLSEVKLDYTTQRKIRALILTPTRELALQIFESFKTYGQYTDLRYSVIFGGVPQKPQEMALKKGVDVVVATPGRLIDLMNQRLIDLKHIQMFVLDESDRMLDMGFIKDVKMIITKLPSKKQTLLFSATMPPEISKLAKTILSNPISVAITPISSTVDIIEQQVYFVDKENKMNLLLHILNEQKIYSLLVFSRTKHGADKIVRQLTNAKITAQAIHGDKSQNNRQSALNNFKNGKLRVLVATDIAARGIDIDDLTHVLNYDLPNEPETYVHRIGRTGRAGKGGIAISFCNFDELPYLKNIEKLIGKTVSEIKHHPYPMLIKTETPTKLHNNSKSKQIDLINKNEKRSFNKGKIRISSTNIIKKH